MRTSPLTLLIACLIAVQPAPAATTQRAPLTLEQIQALVKVGSPDSAVAQEITTRGLATVPSLRTLEDLRASGAGDQTIAAVERLRPLLEEAREVLPGLVRDLFSSLHEGNTAAVRPLVTSDLMSRPATSPWLGSASGSAAQGLDFITQPYSHQAAYIEQIVEKSGRQLRARVRALSTAGAERALVFTYSYVDGRFVLTSADDVIRVEPEAFSDLTRGAVDLTRRFLFAMRARDYSAAARSVSSGLNFNRMVGMCPQLDRVLSYAVANVAMATPQTPMAGGTRGCAWQFREFTSVTVEMVDWKGLKALVQVATGGTCCEPHGSLWVDLLDGELRIVAWRWRYPEFARLGSNNVESSDEDPQVLEYTKRRFASAR